MQIWNVLNFLITGTPDDPQTVNYGDLTDVNGYTLPSSISKPSVGIPVFKQDRGAYIVKDSVGTESFQISKSGSGVGDDVYVDLKICENVDPWLEH